MLESMRQPEYPVDLVFTERWSPRAFTGEPISTEDLLTIIEAGRWAPSAYNIQPWRFVYARAGTPAWDALFSVLLPFNQRWAQRASALLLATSATHTQPPGAQAPAPNGSHEFDAGAAFGYIALQATLLHWNAHAMTGIDKDLARIQLGIPASHAVHAAMAIGRRSEDSSFLPESLQARETPSQRLPLAEIAAEGAFRFGSPHE